MDKTEELNLTYKLTKRNQNYFSKAPILLTLGALCFLPSCIMTKAQGDRLAYKVNKLEEELSKIQMLRHDLQVLLDDQVKVLFHRMSALDAQIATMRDSLNNGSEESKAMASELQNLRGELEIAHHTYKNLQKDQQTLAQHQQELAKVQSKIAIPPLKEEHLALAKKLLSSEKYDDAEYLFEAYTKEYAKDKDTVAQAYYSLAEMARKRAESSKEAENKLIQQKKSVVAYQKAIENFKNGSLKEDSLFKLGLILRDMGNKSAAIAVLEELLAQSKDAKRLKEAKEHIASLKR